MKTKTMKLAAFIAALFLVTGCASSQKAGTNDGGLDAAMRKISDYLNERIPQRSKVVFLNVKSNWPDLSEYILSGLSENAVNDGVFSVVDRQQLDAIRAELNFQWSGEVSDASAQEIGKMLGAQTIVSGTVTTLGDEYRIQVRAIVVQTAAVQGQTTQTIDGKGKRVVALTKKVGPSGSGGASSGTSTAGGTSGSRTQTGTTTTSGTKTQSGTQTAQTAAYKIGDTGPAGGLIFYDKGNNKDGWRYMEAAPSDIGTAMAMPGYPPTEMNSVYSRTFNEAGRGVGKGKYNTEYFMEIAKASGGGFGWAAQLCDTYELNGFDDWFLPSRDELNYMYGNLYMRGIGNFRSEKYWSSTAYHIGANVWFINFSNNEHGEAFVNNKFRVRPIRQF